MANEVKRFRESSIEIKLNLEANKQSTHLKKIEKELQDKFKENRKKTINDLRNGKISVMPDLILWEINNKKINFW